MKEASARIKINKLLEVAGWRFFGNEQGPANIRLEPSVALTEQAFDEIGENFEKSSKGYVDFLMLSEKGFPLIVLEAKAENKDPLVGKEQARRYARSLDCRFVILSNGNIHYFWDLERGNPSIITAFPTPTSVIGFQKVTPDLRKLIQESVDDDYVALTQRPGYAAEAGWRNESERPDFIKLFLRTGNASRVLFLVDRLELETQAVKQFNKILKNDYKTVIYKESRDDWRGAEIVVTTVQSLLFNNKYQRLFSPTDFDLVISDEAHRSIGGNARAVFDYFIGYKLGLTATPRDYLKKVDQQESRARDPREFERRLLLDTYRTFGCNDGQPTYRYSLLDGVKDGFLINPTVVDARSDITTQLLSDEGYVSSIEDEEGNSSEESFTQREFEKRFFSEATNQLFCKTFLENALRDPVSGEIGKSIVFAVSQSHATKITQILNHIAVLMFPGKYQSDFAVALMGRSRAGA